MALSTLGFLIITSIPVVIGVAEAIDGQKRQNQEAKDRVKFRLTTRFSADGVAFPEQAVAVFKDKKVSLPPLFAHFPSGPHPAAAVGLMAECQQQNSGTVTDLCKPVVS